MATVVETTNESKPDEYPGTDIPCIYADGVLSQSWSNGGSKIYLFREDFHPMGTQSSATTLVAQVVMSTHGFAATAEFLVRRMIALRDHADLKRQFLENIKQLCNDAEKA